MRRLARFSCLVWAAGCAVALAILIGARWLRYTTWSDWPALDAVLRRVMVVDTQTFLWFWGYGQIELRTVLLALAVAAIALHRRLPAALFEPDGTRARLTPVALALGLTGLVAAHYMIDANPTVAAACATSLPLAWLLRGRRLPGALALVVWAAFFAAWLAYAGDRMDRLAIVAWAVVLGVTHLLLGPRLRTRDVTLARIAAVVPVNLIPSLVPLVVAPLGATYVGAGLAYSFCEVPDRGTIHAAIPVCGSVIADYEACKDGRIVEYDLVTKKLVATHRFFSPDFYGRLELMICLPDEIQVGVQASVQHGRQIVQSVMAFDVADPTRFTPVVAGPALGNTLAYDAAHDAFFYTSEFSNLLVRLDRKTRQFDDTASQDLVSPWHEPVTLKPFGGSYILAPHAVHYGRNRLYITEWMGGNFVHAIDLDTLRKVASYDMGSGAGLGLSIDPDRDRLFVSSLWGLEIFDLKTDRLIARKRIGLGNRPVVIDALRNRLYVSSMVEGKIRILDRDSLEIIGQVPIGIGSRYPHLTRDGSTLFASSAAAHYALDPDVL